MEIYRHRNHMLIHILIHQFIQKLTLDHRHHYLKNHCRIHHISRIRCLYINSSSRRTICHRLNSCNFNRCLCHSHRIWQKQHHISIKSKFSETSHCSVQISHHINPRHHISCQRINLLPIKYT